jgi:hypothetical protein
MHIYTVWIYEMAAHVPTIDQLIDSIIDDENHTALYHLVRREDLTKVQRYYLLSLTIQFDRINDAEYLLNHGTNPNLDENEGHPLDHHGSEIEPPLHIACARKNAFIVALLLERGADPNRTIDGVDAKSNLDNEEVVDDEAKAMIMEMLNNPQGLQLRL